MTQMTITFPGGARVDAAFGPYVVSTDQPAMGGGQGSAPTPFQTFLASMGTCAGIYVLGFCKQRGLDAGGIRLEQRIEVDPATRMVSKVVLDIHVPADFPEKYLPALIRSAEQCAVKKHMETPPQFVIDTVVD